MPTNPFEIHIFSFFKPCFRHVWQVIPPKEWIPRRRGYDDVDVIIPAPISQEVNGSQGFYQQCNLQQKPLTSQKFKTLAESDA